MEKRLNDEDWRRVLDLLREGKLVTADDLYRAATGGESPDADVITALQAGRKITAVKQYRAIHGASLKQAKDAVEALEAAMRAADPQSLPPPASEGCGCVVLIGLVVTAVILGMVFYKVFRHFHLRQ